MLPGLSHSAGSRSHLRSVSVAPCREGSSSPPHCGARDACFPTLRPRMDACLHPHERAFARHAN